MESNGKIFTLKDAAEQFLACRNVAVFGVSRGSDDTAKIIYEKFKQTGYNVFAINPNTEVVSDIPCFGDLASTANKIEAVVIVTRPAYAATIIQQALDHGTQWLWLHKSFGNSVDNEAVRIGRAKGLNIIDGACPMMFLEPIDGAHRCMRSVLSWVGRIPKKIPITGC